MKKKIIIPAVILLTALTACSSDTAVSDTDKTSVSDNENITDTEPAYANTQESLIDEVEATPMEALTGKDNAGNDIVRICLSITNYSDYSMTTLSDCSFSITQNGTELNSVLSSGNLPEEMAELDGNEVWHTYTDTIEPGEVHDVYMFYYLNDTETPVHIRFTDHTINIVFEQDFDITQ